MKRKWRHFLKVKGHEPLQQRNRALLEILYGSGLRVSERSSLTLSWRWLGEWCIVDPCGKETRIVMFLLAAMRKKRCETHVSAGRQQLMEKHHKRHEIVFVNHLGDGITARRGLSMCWIKSFKVVWRQDPPPHVGGNTFATHLLNHGLIVRTVQELLGPCQLIYDVIYAHVTKDSLQKPPISIQELKYWRQEERIMKSPFHSTNDLCCWKKMANSQRPEMVKQQWENKSSWRGRHAKYAESITVKS